jgi:hypothetical protein
VGDRAKSGHDTGSACHGVRMSVVEPVGIRSARHPGKIASGMTNGAADDLGWLKCLIEQSGRPARIAFHSIKPILAGTRGDPGAF